MLKTANNFLKMIFRTDRVNADLLSASFKLQKENEQRIQNQPTRVFSGSTCEECGATGIPIVYGLMIPQSDVITGGCVYSWDSPEFQCSVCSTRWRVSFASPISDEQDDVSNPDGGAINRTDLISGVKENSRWGLIEHLSQFDEAQIRAEGNISLINAVKLNDVSVLAGILETGADPNIADPEGWTALHIAAGSGNVAATNLLLKAGANAYVETPGGWSPLVCAVIGGWAETADVLIQHGVDPDHVWEDGHTALYHAVWEGEPRTVKALMESGANPDFRGARDLPIIWDAAYYSRKEMVPILVAGGANPNLKDSVGFLMLSRAILMGRPDVVAALITAGANPDLTDVTGFTSRDLAAKGESTEIRDILEVSTDLEGDIAADS